MKQTAVEWFFNALIENQDKTHKQIESIFEQAKALEREQIIRARQDGLDNWFSNVSWDSNLYYNETYGDKRKKQQ